MPFRACCLAFILGALAQAQTNLEWNKPVDGTLQPGQTASYRLDLMAGQYIEIQAEQPEVPLLLTLSDPGAKKLQSVSLTGVATTQLLLQSLEASGLYQLDVSSNRKDAGGKFSLKWTIKRAADEHDRQVSAADARLRALIDADKPKVEDAETLAAEFGRLAVPRRQALALLTAGRLHGADEHFDKAIADLSAALPIWQATGDRGAEARTLLLRAACHKGLRHASDAFDDDQRALTIYRQTNDRANIGSTLVQMTSVCIIGLARFTDAIRYSQEALQIERDLKNPAMEAAALGQLAMAYGAMGRYEDTLEMYQQTLKVFREVKSRGQEAATLVNIGGTLVNLNRSKEAIPYYEQAAAAAKEADEGDIHSTALANLGSCYRTAGDTTKAIAYHQQALEIYRKFKDRQQEGSALTDIAVDYELAHQPQKAIPYFEQSLDIQRETGTRAPETIAALADTYAALNQPRLAIFFGKQAVSLFETIRFQNSDASSDLRNSYVSAYGFAYRNLADMLVSLGRLIEAQQVLTLLKRQEYYDIAGLPDSDQATAIGLTPDEKEWAAKCWDSKDSAAFQQALASIKQHFGGKTPASTSAIDLKEIEAMRTTLAELGHGAAAIYTLVTPERYVAILVTPEGRRSFETKIKAADLNQKILAYRQALQDPQADVRGPAGALYRILIPQALEAGLQKAHAETLMWSLDGSLSYLPLAALYDGSQYLVEKYRSSVFAAAGDAWPKAAAQTSRSSWRVAAFGVSLPHADFPALPAVAEELRGVVKQSAGETGVLDGRRFLDAQFTRDAFLQELKSGYQVVHIASHFQFKPGDSQGSFLLLGDGGKFTLADLKAAGPLFQGVGLLTLSACSTAVGDVQSGQSGQVEAFGILAQKSGAKAVVASLWNVADVSTAMLMHELYRIRQGTAAATEADALRAAQLALLQGSISRTSSQDTRGVNLPGATSPPGKDFRHPYYWAPFILMGDWR
jgi:CHAT domain-containing protein